jgi:hypothetical protein
MIILKTIEGNDMNLTEDRKLSNFIQAKQYLFRHNFNPRETVFTSEIQSVYKTI